MNTAYPYGIIRIVNYKGQPILEKSPLYTITMYNSKEGSPQGNGQRFAFSKKNLFDIVFNILAEDFNGLLVNSSCATNLTDKVSVGSEIVGQVTKHNAKVRAIAEVELRR